METRWNPTNIAASAPRRAPPPKTRSFGLLSTSSTRSFDEIDDYVLPKKETIDSRYGRMVKGISFTTRNSPTATNVFTDNYWNSGGTNTAPSSISTMTNMGEDKWALYGEKIQALRVTEDDAARVACNTEQFRKLKKQLRETRCMTNSTLQIQFSVIMKERLKEMSKSTSDDDDAVDNIEHENDRWHDDGGRPTSAIPSRTTLPRIDDNDDDENVNDEDIQDLIATDGCGVPVCLAPGNKGMRKNLSSQELMATHALLASMSTRIDDDAKAYAHTL